MFKGSLLSLAVLAALTAASPADARQRHADEWSSARHTTHHHRYVRRGAVRYGYAQPGQRYAQPGQAGQQQGDAVCRRDAIRLCKPVLAQGNMAVLGCFRSRAGSLSRGCRALLQSYGQL